MTEIESELAMVQRHVREGERIVAQQRDLLCRMQDQGLSTVEAELLLCSFEDTQRQHKEHLARIT